MAFTPQRVLPKSFPRECTPQVLSATAGHCAYDSGFNMVVHDDSLGGALGSAAS
jgi:hypothetical protein